MKGLIFSLMFALATSRTQADYLGSWKIDDLLTFTVNTHSTSGAAADADSAPAYRVYEDETGTAILSGSVAKLDDTNTTGFYSEQINLSSANGFERGKSYNVYISATVGGTIRTVGHSFQIAAASDVSHIAGSSTPVAQLAEAFDNDGTGGDFDLSTLSVTGGATISNAGNALTITSTASNGNGILVTGHGTGEGASIRGGADGSGFEAIGGASSGHGIVALATASGSGAMFTGGGTGDGASFTSGNGSTGNGITAQAASTNGNGFSLTGTGNQHGILATAGATGSGFSITASGGSALAINSTGGNGHGVSISGDGTGEGMSIAGGASGHGVEIDSGGSAGDGINIVSATANGIDISSVGGNGHGIETSGNGSGVGFNIVGGLTGDGLQIDGGGGSADDIDLAGDDWPDLLTVLDPLLDDGTAAYDRTTDSLQAQRDEQAAVKAKTDNLPASPAAVGSAMTLAGGAISAGTFAASAIDANAIANNAIDRAALAADTGLQSVRSAQAQTDAAQTSTSIKLDTFASGSTDFYKHNYIYLTGGTGVGQYRLITAYNASTKVATVTPAWTTNPDGNSTFAILPAGIANVEAWFGAPVIIPNVPGIPKVDITHLLGDPVCD